jgi:Cdc6-like AAA superfamily ATPase
MKKSVLLFGKKGTGKTHKLNELMSVVDKSRSIEMRFNEFQLAVKSELKSHYDVIAIDNVITVRDIDYLSMATLAYGFVLIVAIQKSVKELETIDLSAFEVVECSYSYTGA